MNAKSIAKYYDCLTPEERFRLILAAGAHGDEAEQGRLRSSGQSLVLRMADYSPWAHAFNELVLTLFLEMLEETAKHHDAFEAWCDADEAWKDEPEAGQSLDEESQDDGASDEAAEGTQDEMDCTAVASSNSDEERSMPTRTLDLYLAQGFVLKTKIAGWKLFCERLTIPPFALWQLLPGFERLQNAMQLLEDNEFRPAPVFRPKGMLRWLSRIRPEGASEPSMENLISPERFADDLEKVFRQRAEWWGG